MLSHVTILHAATFGVLHNSIRFISLESTELAAMSVKKNKTNKIQREILEMVYHVTILHGFFFFYNLIGMSRKAKLMVRVGAIRSAAL